MLGHIYYKLKGHAQIDHLIKVEILCKEHVKYTQYRLMRISSIMI